MDFSQNIINKFDKSYLEEENKFETILKITTYGEYNNLPIVSFAEMKVLIISTKSNIIEELQIKDNLTKYFYDYLNMRPKKDGSYFIDFNLDKINYINQFTENDIYNITKIEKLEIKHINKYNLVVVLTNRPFHKWLNNKPFGLYNYINDDYYEEL
jgi:hypothetical protein